MSDIEAMKERMLAALRRVEDPASGKDIVGAGLVKDVTFCDGAAKVTLAFTAGPPVRDAIRKNVVETIGAIEGVEHVNVAFLPAESAGAEPAASPVQAGGNPGNASIIAVASGKGGVGKSTIAVNLACGLAARGARVGLLDADVYGPSIPMMLGVRKHPDVIEKGGRKQLVPVEAHGIRLMSMGFLVEEDKPLIWRGPMLHGALRQFLNDVDWGELDHLVLDLPPGTGDVALTMVQTVKLAGAVIVSTPQNVAMIDARKALAMFNQTSVPVIGIVENMSGDVFGRGGCERWAGETGVTFLGSVPLVAGIRESGDEGRPAVLSDDPTAREPLVRVTEAVASRLEELQAGTPRRRKISIRR